MDTETDFCIVLHIIEGIGLNINNNDLLLTATLNGVKFEIKGHNTQTNTIFNSNCIWECGADDLKRMKTNNRPIKVECLNKITRNNECVTKPIGFILLPIRTLQTIRTPKNLQIKFHWYKFCGLAKEWRQSNPELYISAIITTKELMDSEKLEDFMEPKPIDSSDSIYIKSTETSLMLKSQAGIYVNLLESECRIQVGNDPQDVDTFFLALTLKNAKHLGELVGGNELPVFRFHYDILGNPSDMMLVPNADGVYNINEKIIINFKSSLDSLKKYFRRVFYIPIDLYYNDNIIGNYTLKLVDLMPSSMDLLAPGKQWEVKESFSFVTLFDILESPLRPVVEYTLCLSYVPAENQSSNFRLSETVDKQACGDMGDNFECLELPPTLHSNRKPLQAETKLLESVTHRVNVEKKECPKTSRSDSCVCYTSQPQPQPEMPDNDDIAYQVIAELEDWKAQQMKDFIRELKQKETLHLDRLSKEVEEQRLALTKDLTDKLDQCNKMTEDLEETQCKLRLVKQTCLEKEQALEKAKIELDKDYTIKTMETEEKVRRIQDEMEHQRQLHELQCKHLLDEKNMKSEECSKLQAKIKELEEEIKEIRKDYIPKEQFLGLMEDLKKQSERLLEIETSKNFYKEQWAKETKNAHSLKMQSLKIHEEKLKETGIFSIDNVLYLRNLIFEECSELTVDKCELENIKGILSSGSELSDESENENENENENE